MLKNILIIIALISLSGCATPQKYNQKLNLDIGKTSQQIISQYGNPTKIQHLANGDDIITYTSINYSLIPSPQYDFDNSFYTEDELFTPFTQGYNEIPIGDYMGDIVQNYCQTKFYLRNNIVSSWQWKGNSCVAL